MAVLALLAVLLGLRSVQAGKQGGLLGATQDAEEQVRLGTASPEVAQPYQAPQTANSADFPTLNADDFHQEIVDIDRLVFARDAWSETRRTLLAGHLERLADRVKASSSTRFMEIECAELKRLAQYASSAPSGVIENHWMRIRNNVFDDRAWFARSADDLEPATESKPDDPFVPVASPGDTSASSAAVGPPPHGLEGRWRVREIYGNGRPISDPEMSNALVTFAGDELVIQPPAGSPSYYRFKTTANSGGSALRLESDRSNKGPAENGWMIYEFGERELKLAFYDGLGERPPGFTAPAGKGDPMLTVVILQRER